MSERSPYAGQEEDLIDRGFTRKLAYPVAVVCARLGVHPNTVSIAGMLLGVAAGWWFQFRDGRVVWGVTLLIVSTILDNADGMVARMTNKSSTFGYILDGLCDTFVFISVYVGGIYGIWGDPTPFGGTWGPWAWALAVVAGFSHGRQSAMLDFYKMEWRYWACRHDDHRFKTPAEFAELRTRSSGIERLFMGVHAAHARRQASMARVRRALAPQMEAARSKSGFADRYASLNRLPMKGWFLMGPNWHVIAVCAFALVGRMDLYFWSQILLFNAVLLGTMVLQASRDKKLIAT